MAWIVLANGKTKEVRTEKQAFRLGLTLSEFCDYVVAYPVLKSEEDSKAWGFEGGRMSYPIDCYGKAYYIGGTFIEYRTYIGVRE